VFGNEMALYSDTLKTAGRTDLFCRFQGVYTIADYKTSSKDKKEGWIEDYFIQSTTYAMMVEEMYRDIKPIHIPQLAIIIAIEGGESKHQLFVKKTADYRDKVKDIFSRYYEFNTLPNPADYPPESPLESDN
jgi:genome maintenance exonuclease 1